MAAVVEITYADALGWVKDNKNLIRGLLTEEVSSEFGTLYNSGNKARSENFYVIYNSP